jgi:excisionase family DNA binding protein
MTEMFTAKEMQDLLHVDRSTIYRMAEAGQLPAVKVGKQWRFPSGQVEHWLNLQTATPTPSLAAHAESFTGDFAAMLPLDCVQLIQDAFAEALGVMLVVTDLDGQPITQVSNPLPLYRLLSETEKGHEICHETWQELGRVPALEPRFMPGFAGLLCARALVRIGNELKAMVILFGLAPQDWPPSSQAAQKLAQSLDASSAALQEAFTSVFRLSAEERAKALITIQRIADILAHIGNERQLLLDRLSSIAKLSAV